MRASVGRLLAVGAIVAGTANLVVPVAIGDPSQGTFTKITTPSGTTTFAFDTAPAAVNHFTVSGVTSLDVSSVTVDCLLIASDGQPVATVLASNVPVSAGAFSTIATIPTLTGQCRLRAIPAGVSLSNDYLESYSGPLLYEYTEAVETNGDNVPYGYSDVDEVGDGLAIARDAGTCGASTLGTVALPQMQAAGLSGSSCSFALPAGNLVAGLPTGSSIKVDGHNAYLPSSVQTYLIDDLSLPVTQSSLTTTTFRAANGDMTTTESAPLMRCSVADTYPPTLTSCPSLVGTGVTFHRVTSVISGAHEIQLRDSFLSTDGAAHAVNAQYQGSFVAPPTGQTGYTYPGHGTTFTGADPGDAVTGFGTTAGTVFVRSDLYADPDDAVADTLGVTWSRPPSSVQFFQTGDDLALPYSLTVPAHGTAYLGFALLEHVLTADTQQLAGAAVAAMVNPPTITSPANGATVKSKTTTVKGKVSIGANGLPTSVTVNGHAAKLTVGTTSATYRASFKEPNGKHAITVIATDAAGNASSKKIKIHNKHKTQRKR